MTTIPALAAIAAVEAQKGEVLEERRAAAELRRTAAEGSAAPSRV
jgi:hypothetical protein